MLRANYESRFSLHYGQKNPSEEDLLREAGEQRNQQSQ